MDIAHFVLPKFTKTDLQKWFGVRRITCFALDFSTLEQYRERMLQKIEEFNNNFVTKPDLDKFRYADDSMFN
jgi:hypothetical protein